MHEIILCKLGEVVLKGLNRHSFETKLMSNIRRRTQKFGKFKIYSRQSTIYVEPMSDSCDLTGANAACKQVFVLIAIARHIGTFDTSILPYEDCCTVFTPRHPKTKPHVEEVREIESVLDIDGLMERAMREREVVKVKL